MHLQPIVPHITEKTLLNAAHGQYTFRVKGNADKNVIRQNIDSIYGVNVTRIATINLPGKARRVGKKMRTKLEPGWKKAIVELRKGQTIAAFSLPDKENK